MRLFLAIQLSPAVREALLTAQDALRRQGRGSFPPPENLHLTLAFLGEAEDPARARAALSEVSCRPCSLAVGGPPGHFGDLWWAGVRADPALEELAVSLQADLRSRGFCQEGVTLPYQCSQYASRSIFLGSISHSRFDRTIPRLLLL